MGPASRDELFLSLRLVALRQLGRATDHEEGKRSSSAVNRATPECALAMVSILLLKRKKRSQQKNGRKWWVRPWLSMRDGKGHFHSLTKDLLDTDHPSFRNWIGMDMDKFATIVDMIQAYPNLEKQSSHAGSHIHSGTLGYRPPLSVDR